jgi:thiol-disulfide isomerase/thioredoxin
MPITDVRFLTWLPAVTVLVVMGLVTVPRSEAATSAPAVIRIGTGDGTLVVRVDDPDISVQVEKGEIVITGAGPKELRLKPTDLKPHGSVGGTPEETVVSITRDGKKILDIRLDTRAPAAGSASAAEAHPATNRLFNPDTGHDYQRIDVPMTWHEAKKYCEQLGGHLATATSAEENEFLYNQFGRDHVCWLGATDEEAEGTWKWVTGEAWDFENWHSGEPSNNGNGSPENYLAFGDLQADDADGGTYFYRFGSNWNDHVGTGEFYGKSIAHAICEWDEHDPQLAASTSPARDELSSLRELQRAMSGGASSDKLISAATAYIKAFPDSPRNSAVAQMLVFFLTRGQDEQQSIETLRTLAENEVSQVADAARVRIEQLELLLRLKEEPLELKFTTLDGQQFDIADYRGKVVLIDFWATWCGPCVAGMPELIELYKTQHDQGLEIVGISFDSDKQALEKFVAEHEMPWVQFFDGKGWDNEYGRQFGIRAIPTMWLIGRDGKVVDFSARTGLTEKVQQLVDE